MASGNQAQAKVQRLKDQMAQIQATTVEVQITTQSRCGIERSRAESTTNS
ncbi:hypothetical protein Gotur_010855, partial [Gossypium turneri]